MRDQERAAKAANDNIVDTVTALQDADAPVDLIDRAERLQSDIQEFYEGR